MDRWVEIEFNCLPLRSIGRLDIPLDASPKYREFCERIKGAIEKHGSHNSYYLYKATCRYHLLNHPQLGMIEFRFEGTVITDDADMKTSTSNLQVDLVRETCDWLTEPVVKWFHETVAHSVEIEFDRYIAAGDLDKAKERMEKIRAQAEESGGFMGYL
jgi:hypothetical protein